MSSLMRASPAVPGLGRVTSHAHRIPPYRHRLGGERPPSHPAGIDTIIDAVLRPARVAAGKPDRCVREHPMQAADVCGNVPK